MADVPDHHGCSLGKWYASVSRGRFGWYPAFAVIEAPGAAHGDHIRAGSRGPVHTMSLGKVLVAVLPPSAALGTIRNWHLEALTEHTITDAHRFLDELEVARRRGYALDIEESEAGLCCIAAPIATPVDRPRAAIAIAVETERLHHEPQRLVSHVVVAARRAGALLGQA